MFDILGKIFTTPKSIEKTMDAVINAGDKIVYTAEEKADMNLKLNEWWLKYLETTNPQNVSRRLLALVVSFMWSFLIMTAVTLAIINKDYTSVSVLLSPDASLANTKELTASGFVFLTLYHVVNEPFMIILFFYFGGHYLKEFMTAKNNGK